ncbi:MAG: O-antigen ligase family protein, partial [Anaerolineae bacterium]|nr:O-antigen ligase family protein [Anaerolineae bacterium]
TLIEPLAGLAAALFLGPLWAYLRAEVPQVPAQIAQVFVVLTLAVWLARGLARRDLRFPHLLGEHEGNHKGNHKGLPLLLPLLVFLGAALLSLWDAVELPVYGVPEFIKWVQILLIFLFVSDQLTPQRLPWLLSVLLVTGLFQAGIGIWQFGLRGEGPEHFAILVLGERFYRAYGTFEQPNPYAGYLGITLPLALGPLAIIVRGKLVNWYTGKLGKRRPTHQSTNLPIYQSTGLLIASAALVMLTALGMSWSRGAWMGFGAAVVVMTVALPRQARWGLLLVAVLVVAGLGLHATGLLPASVTARLTDFSQDVQLEDVRGVGISDVNYAVIERLAHWQTALEMTRYNLWTGVGFGCYEPAYREFALINWPIALGHAHNYYLNVVAETGLIGLAAYLFLWGAVFWQTWRVTRRAEGLWRGVAIGLLGTWTHLSVHHLLDNLYVNNVHLFVGVLLGLLAFVMRRTRIAGQ